jgi:hypothetical protein
LIPANADRAYLEQHYALKVEDLGKTLHTVDGIPSWVRVHRLTAQYLTADYKTKTLTAHLEIFADKATPEFIASKVDALVNSLKLEILKREEGDTKHG